MRSRVLRRVIWVLIALVMVLTIAAPAAAQGGAYVAFVNTSGQLIVSSSDGAYRWILTNPGELLAMPVGYTWSPDGRRIFHAVAAGSEVSLRVGDISAQQVYEIGRVPNVGISGGSWMPDGRGVLVAAGEHIAFFDAFGGGRVDLIGGQGPVSLLSPFADDRPNLQRASSVSPDGRFLLYQQGDGRYAVLALDGSAAYPLPGVNDVNARQTGLWSDLGPFVAYWGYEGNSILSATNPANGATITLDSGRTAPITPLAWVPNSALLIYRDASGVRMADVGCLLGGCGDNPLLNGAPLLPATATDIQTDSAYAYYRDGNNLYAVPLSCANAGTCASSIIVLGGNAAPGTLMHVAGGTLAYTAFSTDPNNAADRTVVVVDLGCLNTGSCAPQGITTGAVSGLVSPDGLNVIVEGGSGLATFSLTTFASAYLSDYSGGQLLPYARWNRG